MSDADSVPNSPLPEAGHDPGDPNQPRDKDTPTPPITDPTQDMDHDDLSDNDSVLSEVDEAQFEDFDPNNLAIEERPIAVDDETSKLLEGRKRKRDPAEQEPKKKKKEGRREKPKKKKKDDDDDMFSGGDEIEGKRRRKPKAADGESAPRRPKKAAAPEEDEESLDPEERRRRALDRAMDLALKNPNRRRRKQDGIDLNSMADEEISSLRTRMAEAAQYDVEARDADPPRPAMHKLKLLPEVVALLNRNGREIEGAIVDPENNLLESVRFFLEPLRDGSLPAYNIQRELFAALTKLPIDKDALISSGIGKVVLFYTKSKKPELGIRRTAERLLAEWTRPILKRSDDFRSRQLETRVYDPTNSRGSKHVTEAQIAAQQAEARRRQELAPAKVQNRARLDNEVKTYTIAPQSQNVKTGMYAKPLGASGEDAFRRMKARHLAAQGKGPRRG